MFDNAIGTLKENDHPIIQSDRGAHYRWSGWIERMENAGLTRSMSKRAVLQTIPPAKASSDVLKTRCSMGGLGKMSPSGNL